MRKCLKVAALKKCARCGLASIPFHSIDREAARLEWLDLAFSLFSDRAPSNLSFSARHEFFKLFSFLEPVTAAGTGLRVASRRGGSKKRLKYHNAMGKW
jgi:hypothetical protein